MTRTIALAGKGGTGKTTIAALLIGSLSKRTKGPLLAIDADPSANLHLALGLNMPATVGDIREEMTEPEKAEKVDLLAMGRPEGQGCYCAVNHLLRDILDGMESSYQYVVIDNEAGMEHISRRTTKGVDLLLVASDPTIRGLQAAASIKELANEVDVDVRRMGLVLNRVKGPLPEPLQEAIESVGLEVLAEIPADESVNELDALGKPLLGLDGTSPALQAVEALAQSIINEL